MKTSENGTGGRRLLSLLCRDWHRMSLMEMEEHVVDENVSKEKTEEYFREKFFGNYKIDWM